VKKNFIINLAILLFVNLLVKPIYIFGIERNVQNIVGAEEFGFYFSLFNFSLLLQIILDLGTTNLNNRNIAQHEHMLGKYFSNIVGLKFILAVLYAIVSLSIAFAIGYEPRQLKLLSLLIFNQFLASFVLYLRSNISGMHLFKTDSIISVLDRLLMIIIMSIIIWGNVTNSPLKIEWFVFAQTGSYGVTAFIAFFIVLKRSAFFKPRINIKFFLVFLKESYPYALLILLMAFYNKIDSIMLERMLPDGKAQAGVYAQAFRILDAFSMIAYLFSVLLLPMFARMIKNKEPIEELAKLSSLILIIPSIILATACHMYNFELMDIMYIEHIESSAPILSLLMTGFIGISTTYIFGTLLTANGSLKQLNFMAAAGMILNILLNLILIPKLYAQGSAVASMITQLFTALTQVLIVAYIFKFRINYFLIAKILVFTALSFIINHWVYLHISNWVLALITGISLCVVLAFLLRIFTIKAIIKIIKYDN
jgi:O-antigen/teichoic acid export membrane protein